VGGAPLISAHVHVGTPKTHRSRSVAYPSRRLRDLFDDDRDTVAAALDQAERDSDVVILLSRDLESET